MNRKLTLDDEYSLGELRHALLWRMSKTRVCCTIMPMHAICLHISNDSKSHKLKEITQTTFLDF